MSSQLFMISGMQFYFLFISLAVYILEIIAFWSLFKKANVPGWKSIIPVYNTYTLFKIAWKSKYFWLTLLVSVIYSVAVGLGRVSNLNGVFIIIEGVISVVFGLISLLLTFFLCRKTALVYGKGTGFAIGLFFLYPIFILILGLGSSKYVGNKS